MSAIKDMFKEDLKKVFLNIDEFGEYRNVDYDGTLYYRVQMVIRDIKQVDRDQLRDDYAQGLYKAQTVMHCDISDLGNNQPEKGQRIRISDRNGWMRPYYIEQSYVEIGMVHLALEAIEE